MKRTAFLTVTEVCAFPGWNARGMQRATFPAPISISGPYLCPVSTLTLTAPSRGQKVWLEEMQMYINRSWGGEGDSDRARILLISLLSPPACPSPLHAFRHGLYLRTVLSLGRGHKHGKGSWLWCSLLLGASISIVWKIIYQKQK